MMLQPIQFKDVPIGKIFTTQAELDKWGEENAFYLEKKAEHGAKNARWLCGGEYQFTGFTPDTIVFVSDD